MTHKKLEIENYCFKSLQELFSVEDDFVIIAGPCAIENEEQMDKVAQHLVKQKVRFIRGGAFKPRTSPYSFQGMGKAGLEILDHMRKRYGLIAVTEVVDCRDVKMVESYTDVIQIGSRSMMNYAILKEVGKSRCPIFLKRGMMATLDEFLLAAEYIFLHGNKNIIMCERGIRTFENSTRNMLDIAAIALIKERTSLPVFADMSHSLGIKNILNRVSKGVKAIGCDGIMVEIHPAPDNALSDSDQQLTFDEFDLLVEGLRISG